MSEVLAECSTILRYAVDVVEGTIVAGEAVVGACQRFLDDLEKAKEPDYPYYFDWDHAETVCEFFPAAVVHSVGKYEGQPFVLADWQQFCIGNVFGWKKKSDGTRRFSKVYISVARKNGKSTLAAAICQFAAGFDFNPITKRFESVAQVVIAASKKEQADLVTMAECIRMRERSRLLMRMSTYRNRQLHFTHNNGKILSIGSDRAFDGLNPSLIVVDELHAFRSTGNQAEFYGTMKTGSGSRAQPIFIITTTAGTTLSSLWLSERNYAVGVATGEFEDDSYFCASYEIDEDDDPLDEEVWIKANPCLGVTLDIEYLREQARPAQVDTIALNHFTRYHTNRVVSSLAGAFMMDKYDECKGELSNFKEADAVCGGIDLGGRDDLAAYAIVARFKTGESDKENMPIYRYEGFARSFIDRTTPRDLSVLPFRDYVENGILCVTDQPLTDLFEELMNDCRLYGVCELAFDPYQAAAVAEQAEQRGVTCVAMPQTTGHFNSPITELRQCIADGRLTHDGCPLLRWAFNNAVTDSDRQDRLMYSKRDSAEKIDPCVAFTMAFSRATHAFGKTNDFLIV